MRSLQPDCAVASGASERHSGNSVQGSSALPAEGLGLLGKTSRVFSAGSECLPSAEFCYSGHAGPAGGKHRTGREGKKKILTGRKSSEDFYVVRGKD